MKFIHDVEFKNHQALKSSVLELPKEALYLREKPFRKNKALSHICKLVKHKISVQEQNYDNILQQYSTAMSSTARSIGPIMQVYRKIQFSPSQCR